MPDVRCPVVVGREGEISAVHRAVAGASDGGGGLIFVLGEAGVGKTRLGVEAAAVADTLGMAVLRGRAVPSPAPAPYRPVSEALLGAFRDGRPPAADELAPFGPVLRALVPTWGGADDAPPAEPSVIFAGEAALALIRRVASPAGALMVLDDLHWSDAATLELLDYLADKLRGTGALVVATSRTGEGAAAERLARRLRTRDAASVVELRRLSGDGVAAMVAAALGAREVPAGVVEAVAGVSDGLPFLVEEVLASLVDSGSLACDEHGWQVRGRLDPAVPPSFAALVADRMDQLPEAAAAILRAAAVLGERFDGDLLARAAGARPDDVTTSLRLAGRVQLVEEDRGTRSFRFRHALTRAAVLDSLLAPERSAVAQAALQAIRQEVGGSRPERLALAADLADTAGDAGQAVELLVAAAEAAHAAGAVAAELAAARAVIDRAVEPDRIIRGYELLLRASVSAGDVRGVVEIGEGLLARLEAAGCAPPRLVAAHLDLASAAVAATDWRRATDHLGRATALVPAPDEAVAARTQLLQAQVALGDHRAEDASVHAQQAHELAARTGDADLVCGSLEVLGRIERLVDVDAAERRFTGALIAAEAAGLAVHRCRALHELGTIDMIALRSPDRLLAARQAALDIGAPGLAAQAAMHLAVACFVRHSLGEAREAAERAVSEARRYRLGLLVPAALMVVGAVDAVQGRRQEAIAVFEEALPLSDAEVEATGRGHVLAIAALADEDRDNTLVELRRAEEICPVSSGVRRAPIQGLYALLQSLDPGAGAALAQELVGLGSSMHAAGLAMAEMGLAVAAGRRGDAADASSRFERAAAALEEAPWYLNMARRLVAEAALTDGWGHPDRWLLQALEFFAAVPLEAPQRACQSLLKKSGSAVPRPADRGVDLGLAALGITPREAEVLALVAEGLSNKGIAGRLYLSARTVEKHVERLLQKTGSANRAQLAARAVAARSERVPT